ncbi:MAG TPA: tetratricopeptide repeat protein [Candidatus Acidoferrum sp.]|nr:tetratricopeptide repeat protein [Candidatus Acidoferrum sp.]
MPDAKLHPTDYMRRVWRNAYCLAILALLMLGAPAHNFAQDSSSKPADAPPAPQPKLPAKPNQDSATQSAPDQPTWDPLRAEKDLEVGHYYMKKGDWDAAIDRFQDAIVAKPGYAIPYLYLGEAQEKKGVKKQAIKSYTRYLDLYPHAEDADKIRKRIDKLWGEIGKGKKSAG